MLCDECYDHCLHIEQHIMTPGSLGEKLEEKLVRYLHITVVLYSH